MGDASSIKQIVAIMNSQGETTSRKYSKEKVAQRLDLLTELVEILTRGFLQLIYYWVKGWTSGNIHREATKG